MLQQWYWLKFCEQQLHSNISHSILCVLHVSLNMTLQYLVNTIDLTFDVFFQLVNILSIFLFFCQKEP